MKKIAIIFALISLATATFAANSEKDFDYKLSADMESVVITGLKNNLTVYDIPDTIEEMPVTAVDFQESAGYDNEKEITLKLPESIKKFSLRQFSGGVKGRVVINGLPKNLEKFEVRSQVNRKNRNNFFVLLKGSVNSQEKLTSFVARYVEFEETAITVKKEWTNYDFLGSNVTEVSFEEGCETIGGFSDCKSLAKVTLPSTAKKLKAETFHYCTSLSEIVIPDSITSLNFEYDPFMLKGTALPLKSQAKLKKLGYTGHFSD